MSEDSSNAQEKLLNNCSEKNNEKTNFFSSNPDVDLLSNSNIDNLAKDLDVSDPKNFKFDGLTNLNIFGYGIGHFLNDLTAAGWFNYLTIYLKSINPIDPHNAGFFAGFFSFFQIWQY